MESGTSSANHVRRATIAKNGVFWSDGSAASYPGQPIDTTVGLPGFGLGVFFVSLATPVLEVVPGDYFELHTFQDSGSSRNVAPNNLKHGNSTFLGLEVVE